MNNQLSFQRRKEIVTNVISDLEQIKNCFQIKTENFSILVIKVLEILRKHTELTSANRYQLGLDILNKIASELVIPADEKVYLMSIIPSLIFDLSDINLRGIQNIKKQKKDKKKKDRQLKSREVQELQSEAIYKFEEYIERLYNHIAKMILTQDLEPSDIPSQIINIIVDVVNIIDQYKDLRGLEKKQLIIRAFDKIYQHIQEIFPNITEEELRLIDIAFKTLPSLIESIIAVLKVKYDINIEDVFKKEFWRKLCCCNQK